MQVGIIIDLRRGERAGLASRRRSATDNNVIGALIAAAKADQFNLRLVGPYGRIAARKFVELQRLVLIEKIGKGVSITELVERVTIGLTGLQYKGWYDLAHLRG